MIQLILSIQRLCELHVICVLWEIRVLAFPQLRADRFQFHGVWCLVIYFATPMDGRFEDCAAVRLQRIVHTTLCEPKNLQNMWTAYHPHTASGLKVAAVGIRSVHPTSDIRAKTLLRVLQEHLPRAQRLNTRMSIRVKSRFTR
jgi:hypothetical protein